MKSFIVLLAFVVFCITSCTSDEPVVLPTLTTDSIVTFSQTEAVILSNVVMDGNATILSSGVIVDVTSGLDMSRSTFFNSGDPRIGSYTTYLTGLVPNTTYYVRAVATNSAGTAYGNEIQFTTLADDAPTIEVNTSGTATYNSAKVVISITKKGTAPILEYGLVYGKTINPTVDDTKFATKEGMGATATLTELSDNTKYYVRGYVLTRSGVSYGNPISFITAARILPTVQTSDPTAVTINSASVQLNVSVAGSSAVTERGIVYGTTTAPTITTGTKVANGSGVGTVTVNLTGLQEVTKYYVRAYATSDAGTSYGREVTFQTYASALPATYRGEWYDLTGKQWFIITDREIVVLPNYISYLYGSTNSVLLFSGEYRVTANRIGGPSVTFFLRQSTNTNALSINASVIVAKDVWKVVGNNVMDVRFGTGKAGITWSSGNVWKEKNDEGVEQAWTYTEMSRLDWQVLLRRNDNILYLIDVEKKTISTVPSGGGGFTFLYAITEMYAW